LFSELPESSGRAGEAIAALEMPRGMSGMMARRRLEKARSYVERAVRESVDRRIAALEKRAEDNPQDWEAQRALGALSILESHWARANAHLETANRLQPNDYEITVNYAIVLAQRGQLASALEMLTRARAEWPDTPAVLLNLAMVALQARRAPLVLEAVAQLEALWDGNAALAQDFHDQAQTLRGLALLQQSNPYEARRFLGFAARHTVVSSGNVARYDLEKGGDQRSAERRQTKENLPAGLADRRTGPRRDEDAPEPAYAADAGGEDAGSETLLSSDKNNDADLLNNLAMAEAASGESNRAVARLAAALRMDPGNARVHNNLGVLAYTQGHMMAALKHLEIARDIENFTEHPEPVTFSHLGVVLSAMGRNQESLEEFQRAGAHERAELEVWYNLGRAYIEHGKPDRGVEFLRRAFQADPNDADVHAVLGGAYLLRGQMQLLPDAMKHLKRALQLNPRHRVALANIAMALIEMGQNEQALKVVQEDIKAHPRGAEAIFLLGILVLRMADDAAKAAKSTKQDDQAIARAATLFHRAADVRPDLLVCLYNMALCQYVVGFREAASKQLENVVSRDSSLGPAYYMIGVGHADAKRFDEALAVWKIAAKYEPGNADLQANMGYVYYQRGDWTNAIMSFVRAHNAAPQQADLLSSLGLCYARAGQLPHAVNAFEESLRIAPHAPVTHSNLGLAFYFQKQIESALDQWRIVAQLDANYAASREEEQYRNFDDSLVSMRPLNWRARLIKLAPVLPSAHIGMVPGYNARAFRPVFSDPALKEIEKLVTDLNDHSRTMGWLQAHK